MRPPLKGCLATAAFLLLLGMTLIAAGMRHPAVFFDLQGTWQRQVDDQTDTRLELQVKGKKMEYRFVSERFPELSSLLHTYEWSALDKDTIRVHYDDEHWVDADITMDGSEMTFSPAVTLQESTETWHRVK